MKEKKYTRNIAGKEYEAIFSDLANQANGSVILKCEDTIVLATAVISKGEEKGKDFFNLTVDYQEKFYASGLILGGQYNKREGKPSDKAILSSRVIDRTIRPLFDQRIKNSVQVIATVLSLGKSDPTILAVNAVSMALHTSDIPWQGPVGAVHIGIEKGKSDAMINNYIPNTGETVYDLDLTICARKEKICMIEAQALEKNEELVGEVLDVAVRVSNEWESWQEEIKKTEAKEKIVFEFSEVDQDVKDLFEDKIKSTFDSVVGENSKKLLHEKESEWNKTIEEFYGKDIDGREDKISLAKDYFQKEADAFVHGLAIEQNKRVDMRDFSQVRPLYAKAGGISPVLHGSGIFYRGETHVLSVTTLGGPDDMNEIEGMEVRGKKRFMHYYNFPPFSSGETGRVGGTNRREMGHGFLAEKALASVMPEKEIFPYTVRVVSEALASNGSTSQASICAGCLSLMDAGVPIKAPVAGIAMGLMQDEKDETKYKILTDIQGAEDHYGDMDFKVAGSANGITAIQLDIKLFGVSTKILKEAMTEAKKARLQILDVMKEEISEPRKEISPNAPKILLVKIKQEQIGLVIGSGGKTVNGIREKTGAEINIEDDGTVFIVGKGNSADEAKKIIESLVKEYKVGDIEIAEVIKIIEVGAIASLSPNADGLIHISEISPDRVEKISDYLKIGDRVPVKIIKVDRDRISLSIKQANPEFFKK